MNNLENKLETHLSSIDSSFTIVEALGYLTGFASSNCDFNSYKDGLITYFNSDSLEKLSNLDIDLIENNIEEIRENIKTIQTKIVDKLLKLDDQSQDEKDDEPFDSPGSTNEIEQENMEDSSDTDTSDSESTLEDINIEIDDTEQQAAQSTDGASIDEEIDALSYPHDDFANSSRKDYSIFTSDFDEVIDAKDLTTPDESIRLRNQLDNLIKPYQTTIGKLANRLQRLLLAKQNTSWNFNLEEGMLDTARLH